MPIIIHWLTIAYFVIDIFGGYLCYFKAYEDDDESTAGGLKVRHGSTSSQGSRTVPADKQTEEKKQEGEYEVDFDDTEGKNVDFLQNISEHFCHVM